MQENIQQQSHSKTAAKVSEQTSETYQALNQCPNCNAEIPEDAAFCPECRFALKQRICPHCGKGNVMSADICQFCGTWLLEGQCKFCYAPLEDGNFCPECGKPKDGLPCPKCGQLSIFDFCKHCGTPVTDKAVAAIQAAKTDPENPAPVAVNAQTAEIEAQLAQLETLINSEPEPVLADDYDYEDEPEPEIEEKPVHKSLFSAGQLDSIMKTGAGIDAAQKQRVEEARLADERRKDAARIAEQQRREAARIAAEQKREAAQQAAAERQRQVQEYQQLLEQKKAQAVSMQVASQQNAKKKFRTSQDARVWHNARHNPDAIGWLCNAFGTVHLWDEGGPNNCDDPSKGGCDYFGEIKKRRDGYCWVPLSSNL